MTECDILDAHVLLQQAVVASCPVLDAKHGDRLAARLAHGVQEVLLEKFGAFVRRNAHVPLLIHYQSDATSYLTFTPSATRSFDGKVLKRSGHHISDDVSERTFVCARHFGSTTHESAALVLIPRSLEHGKGALQCFSANVASVALPRQYGHLNLSFTHYCFDGAQFDAQFRLAQQRHEGWWETTGREAYGVAVGMYKNFDVVLGCSTETHGVFAVW